jgi:hypothetical protein
MSDEPQRIEREIVKRREFKNEARLENCTRDACLKVVHLPIRWVTSRYAGRR